MGIHHVTCTLNPLGVVGELGADEIEDGEQESEGAESP